MRAAMRQRYSRHRLLHSVPPSAAVQQGTRSKEHVERYQEDDGTLGRRNLHVNALRLHAQVRRDEYHVAGDDLRHVEDREDQSPELPPENCRSRTRRW